MSAGAAGVCDELSVDGVADVTLQGADRFSFGLALGDFAVEVLAAEGVVAELVPEVVTWNRTLIGAPAGHPLADKRSHVVVGDVADIIRQEPAGFDAILMDVDNGPEALVRRENDWLYSSAGLRATRAALRSRGVLAVWSSSTDRAFSKRLLQAGFEVREHVVRPHRAGKGPRHHIWIGT